MSSFRLESGWFPFYKRNVCALVHSKQYGIHCAISDSARKFGGHEIEFLTFSFCRPTDNHTLPQ